MKTCEKHVKTNEKPMKNNEKQWKTNEKQWKTYKNLRKNTFLLQKQWESLGETRFSCKINENP